MNKAYSRRGVLGMAVAAGVLSAEPKARPRLGVVTQVAGKSTPEQGIAKVHALGLKTCQAALGPNPDVKTAAALRSALDQYGIEATAMMTLGPGAMVWDFYSGPTTIGLVPTATRTARIDALKRASDVAKSCGVGAIHTHCGFIPENPNDPLYAETVRAIQSVASYCNSNGQIFLMETGQESPITLLRAIQDAGTGNIYVNLDTANLILYGKGEPAGALEVLGKYVWGLHAKDGLYPTDPKKLGRETAIGQGRVDFPELLRKLAAQQYAGPITIEREISGAQQEADLRTATAYLQGLIDSSYA